MQKAMQHVADRGFLWRLRRNGRDSFLYGSMHAGKAEWFALGPRVERALQRTGVLALEINVTDPAVMDKLRTAQQAPASVPLPPDLVADLEKAWVAECLPKEDLGKGPAELQVVQLAVVHAQRAGLFGLYGAESLLLMQSMRVQRPVVGLETPETQLAALMGGDHGDVADLIRSSLDELRRPAAKAALVRLADGWARNDLADLERYAEWCDCLRTPAEREDFTRVVDARNPGMAKAIDVLHRDVSVFAAVGSLHMIGPKGLPVLLRQLGFEVERVF